MAQSEQRLKKVDLQMQVNPHSAAACHGPLLSVDNVNSLSTAGLAQGWAALAPIGGCQFTSTGSGGGRGGAPHDRASPPDNWAEPRTVPSSTGTDTESLNPSAANIVECVDPLQPPLDSMPEHAEATEFPCDSGHLIDLDGVAAAPPARQSPQEKGLTGRAQASGHRVSSSPFTSNFSLSPFIPFSLSSSFLSLSSRSPAFGPPLTARDCS